METLTIEKLRELSQQLPDKIPDLKMLILFGSRATGNIHEKSDWDFAVLYDEDKYNNSTSNILTGFELPMVLGNIFGINSDNIDVVELNYSSWLLSHFIARDGVLIFEKYPNIFESFRSVSLKTDSELKQYRRERYQSIATNLKRWNI
jgi:predicted nucleotidyltransferase